MFLAHVEGDRQFALWRVASTTGMRRGELLGLTWRALELDGARLKVERQAITTQGRVTFGPPKSRRSERTVALDADTFAALRRHRDTQQLIWTSFCQVGRVKRPHSGWIEELGPNAGRDFDGRGGQSDDAGVGFPMTLAASPACAV